MILLDTDILTLVQRKDSPEGLRVRARVLELPESDYPKTTIITYEEQMRGWFAKMAKAADVDSQIGVYERLVQHVENYRLIDVVRFDRAAADQLVHLRKLKLRLGTADLKIAAIALAHAALLVSRNLGDFKRIPGLTVEDWTKP